MEFNVVSNIILKVKEWLQNLGIGDHTDVVHDDEDVDDETVPLHHNDESAKNRLVVFELCGFRMSQMHEILLFWSEKSVMTDNFCCIFCSEMFHLVQLYQSFGQCLAGSNPFQTDQRLQCKDILITFLETWTL